MMFRSFRDHDGAKGHAKSILGMLFVPENKIKQFFNARKFDRALIIGEDILLQLPRLMLNTDVVLGFVV